MQKGLTLAQTMEVLDIIENYSRDFEHMPKETIISLLLMGVYMRSGYNKDEAIQRLREAKEIAPKMNAGNHSRSISGDYLLSRNETIQLNQLIDERLPKFVNLPSQLLASLFIGCVFNSNDRDREKAAHELDMVIRSYNERSEQKERVKR